jgi:hypothetical protein
MRKIVPIVMFAMVILGGGWFLLNRSGGSVTPGAAPEFGVPNVDPGNAADKAAGGIDSLLSLSPNMGLYLAALVCAILLTVFWRKAPGWLKTICIGCLFVVAYMMTQAF